jgi:hypothetical protein
MAFVPQMITVFVGNHPVVFSPDDDKFHIEEFLKVYYGHLQEIGTGMVFPDALSNAKLPVGTYKYQPSRNGERLSPLVGGKRSFPNPRHDPIGSHRRGDQQSLTSLNEVIQGQDCSTRWSIKL